MPVPCTARQCLKFAGSPWMRFPSPDPCIRFMAAGKKVLRTATAALNVYCSTFSTRTFVLILLVISVSAPR